MAKVKYTPEQQNAIDIRGGGVLVSAAAGSGKTAVLTQHVINMIAPTDDLTEVVPANRLMVVTFTQASAGEMKDRIYQKLQDLVEQNPENTLYQSQLVLLENAKISTIDSMCSELVKNNFQQLNISPNYRIGDEKEIKSINETCMENMLNTHYSSQNEGFIHLVNTFYNKDDKNLIKVIMAIYNFIVISPFPLDELERYRDMYNTTDKILDTVWGKIVKEKILKDLHYAKACLEKSISEMQKDEVVNMAYAPAVNNDLDIVEAVIKELEKDDWTSCFKKIAEHKKQRLGAVKDYPNKDFLEDIKTKRGKGVEIFENVASTYFSMSEEDFTKDMEFLKSVIGQVLDLVKEFYESVSAEKISRNVIDFSDLEQFTVRLLVQKIGDKYIKTPLAKSLASEHEEIMVDECQDVNYIQNTIFWALSKSSDEIQIDTNDILTDSKNLFMVGDIKQGIYRFRGAEPKIFATKVLEYITYNKDTHDKTASSKIILKNNFRSREGVCEGINYIFDKIMSVEVGGTIYGEDEKLVASANYLPKEDFCELHLINTGSAESEESKDSTDNENGANGENTKEEIKQELIEATYIADLIEEMISQGFQVEEKGSFRNCHYGDFCILLRSNKSKVSRFMEVFEKKKIDFETSETDSFFNSFEVSTIINMLRAIDNPKIDIPLFTVMLSPIYGFTNDEIAQIRLTSSASSQSSQSLHGKHGKHYKQDKHGKKQSLYSSVLKVVEMVEVVNQSEKDECDQLTQLTQLPQLTQKINQMLDSLAKFRQSSVVLSVNHLIQMIYNETGFVNIVEALPSGQQKKDNLRLLVNYAKACTDMNIKTLSGFVRYIDNAIKRKDDFPSAKASSHSSDSVKIMSIHKSKGLEFPICIVADCNKRFNLMDINSSNLIHEKTGFTMKIAKPESLQQYSNIPLESAKIIAKAETISEEMRVLYVALTRAREKLIMVGSDKDIKKKIQSLIGDYDIFGAITPELVGRKNTYLDWLLLATIDSKSEHIKVINKQAQGVEKEEVETPELSEKPNEEVLKTIKNAIEYKYEDEILTTMPAKVTVTQIAKEEKGTKFDKLKKISLNKNSDFDSAQKGTILHTFMQYVDIKSAKTDLDKEIQRLVDKKFLNEKEVKVINLNSVKAFLRSNLCDRMVNAINFYREYEFIYEMNVGEIFPELEGKYSEEKIVMQGIADTVFEEEDGIVIVDYKTDRVQTGEILKERYHKQLEIYAEVLADYFDKPIKQCVIYSMYLSEEISL